MFGYRSAILDTDLSYNPCMVLSVRLRYWEMKVVTVAQQHESIHESLLSSFSPHDSASEHPMKSHDVSSVFPTESLFEFVVPWKATTSRTEKHPDAMHIHALNGSRVIIKQSLGIQSYLLRYGDWRHSYVGFEEPVVPSEVRYDWIPTKMYCQHALSCKHMFLFPCTSHSSSENSGPLLPVLVRQ